MQLSVAVKATETFIHRISSWIRWISMGTLLIMMIFVTAGVIARYVLNKPIKGDLEIQELMMVLIIFLAFPYCQSEKGNVYVELLADRLKGISKEILHSFAYLIGLVIIALIVWQTGLKAMQGLASIKTNVTLSLYIPVSPFLLVADIGLGLMGVEWIIELIHSIHRVIVSKQAAKPYIPESEA